MRGISRQDAIGRSRLKFIKIVTFQDKALTTKRLEMRDGRLASKAKLKGSQIQDRAQKDSIRDIACTVDNISLKSV
jgi:hypothetical protein